MTADARIEWLRARALELGFDALGIAPVTLPQEAEHLTAWLEAGFAAEMDWIGRNAEVRIDLRRRLDWARSVAVLLQRYRPQRAKRGLLRHIAAYAIGDDYHDLILPRIAALGSEFAAGPGAGSRWHAYVDTGPLLERQLAQAAGLGWLGKHGLLMNREGGSWFFLGVLVLESQLAPTPQRSGTCGSCRACMPACPTGALVAPGVLDARRCISYLTIEQRGPIARELRQGIGEWLFGCDLCQTACPINHQATSRRSDAPAAASPLDDWDLGDLLRLDEREFRAHFRHTALWRPRREGLLRNALIVVANAGRRDLLLQVREMLQDPSPVLREAASWCLAELNDAASRPLLLECAAAESVEWVRAAMNEDLRRLQA